MASVEISEPLLHDADKIKAVESVDQVPEWKDQITVRGLVVSAVLGSLFCIITHKLNLTVGIIPSLNVAAGLLGFFFVKSWTGFLSKLGFSVKPFTRQENTVIQTCVVACYGLAFSGNLSKIFLFIINWLLIGELNNLLLFDMDIGHKSWKGCIFFNPRTKRAGRLGCLICIFLVCLMR